MSKVYDDEAILIGMVLKYGKQATDLLLPQLTHDKFICSKGGVIGGLDHARIWQAVVLTVQMDKREPILENVLDRMSDRRADFGPYLRSLVDRLDGYHKLYAFDTTLLLDKGDAVDRAGIVYQLASKAQRLGSLLEDSGEFDNYVQGIDDVDQWANDQLHSLNIPAQSESTGYKHIEVAAEEALDLLEAMERGEQLAILSSSMQPVTNAGLFPPSTLAVVHGMASSGKSAFVHSVNLGTAIGLVYNNIKGCVAVNSLEMQQHDLVFRAAAMLSGFNTMKLRGGPTEFQDRDYANFKKWIEVVSRLPLYIDPSNVLTTSVMDYRATGLHSSEKGPIWQLSSDYLELFTPDQSNKDNKEQYLDAAIHRHFQLSRVLRASVITISQSTYGMGSDKHRIAGPQGTRYSRAIQHAADIILEVWNPIYMQDANLDFTVPEGMDDMHVWVLIQKFRGGSLGKFKLGWEPRFTRFFDADSSFGKKDQVVFTHMDQVREILEGSSGNSVSPEETDLGNGGF